MISRSPARESNPALRFRRPPCARHTRRDSAESMPSPGIEPGLQPSEGRVRIRHTPRAFRRKTAYKRLSSNHSISTSRIFLSKQLT